MPKPLVESSKPLLKPSKPLFKPSKPLLQMALDATDIDTALAPLSMLQIS